jgi:hypothetical protein
MRRAPSTWCIRSASALVALVSICACGARNPPTPQEFDAWSKVRFPPQLLSKVGKGQIRFEGGDGTSYESAVIIVGAAGSPEGVPAEYLWIARKHGIQGRDWQPIQQSVSRPDAQGRRFDIVTIDVSGEWANRTYYFDVTKFFGVEVRSSGAK